MTTFRWPVLAAGLLLVCAAAGAPPARAQTGTDAWRTLAGGDEVLAMAVDPLDADQVWVGSEGGGVLIWNVVTGGFTQFVYPDEPGLTSNRVHDIAFDGAGDAWLATDRGVTFAPRGAPWIGFDVGDGLPSLELRAVAVEPLTGDVFAGARDGGVAVLRAGDGAWRAFETEAFDPAAAGPFDGPGARFVADIEASDDGRVWVAHGRLGSNARPALSVYDPATDLWAHVARDDAGETGPIWDQVLALDYDPAADVLWLASWRGVLTYDLRRDTWGDYASLGEHDVCGRNVVAVHAADEGEVWVACDGDGVSRFDGALWQTWLLVPDADPARFPEEVEAPTDVVGALVAVGGLAYLGTNGPGDLGSGVLPLDPMSSEVAEALSTAPQTPHANDITALTFGPEGELWVGTRGGGLLVYDGADWARYTWVDTDGLLAGDVISDLVVRPTNLKGTEAELYIATMKTDYGGDGYRDGGISILELPARRWREPLRSESSGLPDDDVGALALDDTGRLWIGLGAAAGGLGDANTVHFGEGVAVYDPDSGRWDFHDRDLSGGELVGNTVLDLAIDGSDVWAAASYHFDAEGRRSGGGASLWTGARWAGWRGGELGFESYHGSGIDTDQDPYITGDVRAIAAGRTTGVWAGTYDLAVGNLSSKWPYVDAVVNRFDGDRWDSWSFAGNGWVSAIVEDGRGDVWAGTTRGHDRSEVDDLDSAGSRDTATGGLRLWNGSAWREITPQNSGLAAKAITALAIEPSTGHLWVGTENGGLSVYREGEAVPTATPCPDCPTATPRPTSTPVTPTRPPIVTVPPAPATATPAGPVDPGQGGATDVPPTAVPGEPEPPPEVPEASTLTLMAAGLLALGAYFAWRRRTLALG